MKHIISVSRRTDIPAFHSQWFFNKLALGRCFYEVYGKTVEVSLLKEDVEAFIFWSKDYAPMLQYLDKLDEFGAPFYFHFTINAYGPEFEPNVPKLEERLNTFKILSERYGKDRIIWRYDPIFLTKNNITVDWHKENFDKLADRIAAFTNTCYISVIDIYNKVTKRKDFIEKLDAEKIYNDGKITKDIIDLAAYMKKTAESYGCMIKTCCEQQLSEYNLCPGACIDTKLLTRISDGKTSLLHKPAPTRDGCGCAKVKDIGSYGTCKFGCAYCYAN